MHDRADDSSTRTSQPATETMANLALVLNVSAIVAFAICLGGGFSGGVAVAVAIAAAFSFLASLVCFAADNESTQASAREPGLRPTYGATTYALGGAA